MPPKKNSNEKKDKKTTPKGTKKKPVLKIPPAKQTMDILKNTKESSPKSIRLRNRAALSKAKELINKDVEDTTDTKKSQSKIKSPKKKSSTLSKNRCVELANEVASYQLAKSLPIINIMIPPMSTPTGGKKKQNQPCDPTGKGKVGRNKLAKQPASPEKVNEISKTSVNAPKRSKKKTVPSPDYTESDATNTPSKSPRPTKTTASKKVRKKQAIDSCEADLQDVPVKKKKVVKKITASSGENANAKKVKVKNDSQKALPKGGRNLEINLFDDTANNIESPSALPSSSIVEERNSTFSPIKDQNETVKKSIQRRKLNSQKKYPNGIIKNNVTSTGTKESRVLDELDSLSWTKQISSSDSACTSVCSSDFVCIDGTLPKLHLPRIDEMSASEMSSIISSPRYSRSSTAKFPPNVKKTSSSSCSSNSRSLQDQKSYDDNLKKTNSMLSSLINSYDMEVMDWIGADHGESQSAIRDNVIYNFFNVESQILNILKNIENIRAGKIKDGNKDVYCYVERDAHSNNDIHLPVGNGDIQAADNEISGFNHDYIDNHNNICNDDEDALSLFAESLTSSRRTSIASKGPEFDEYIPQLTANVSNFQKVTYQPTKIVNNINDEIKTNSVCEKHNADSTSVREMGRCKDDFEIPVVSDKVEFLNNIMSPPMKRSHYILTNKPLQGKYSMVYKGVCFYNLISKCKRFNCTYPHEILDAEDAKNNMSCLPNDMFAQEYTLTRSYPSLRQNFIVAFIEECIKRKLTQLLLEMCIDYLNTFKANSEPISRKTYVLEIIMLHLDEVPLSEYAQFLKHEIDQKTSLCDVFIGAIAVAQNFQQFKRLFVNLADYMLNINRVIDLKVATLIVERLCILPREDAIIKAFFKVIMNTHVEIINCPFIGRFEKRLQSESVKLYEHFLCLKDVITNSLKKQSDAKSGTLTSVSSEEKHSRTSPDTTNLDNSIKIAPVSKLNNNEQRETVMAEDNSKSYTISQTPQRRYNEWLPQNSAHSSKEDRFNWPQRECAVPQYYKSRTRRPGPRSYGAPRGFRSGRPYYWRHGIQPLPSYNRRFDPNRRVIQNTSKRYRGYTYNRDEYS